MFNAAINTIATVSTIETALDRAFARGQNAIDNGWANHAKPFLTDCLDCCGYPPLQDLIDYLRSDTGRRHAKLALRGAEIVVCVIAWLALLAVTFLADALRVSMTWAYSVWIQRGQLMLDGKLATERFVGVIAATPYTTKRWARRQYRLALQHAAGVAKQLVNRLDDAAGCETRTFS